MQVNISGQHIDITDSLRSYVHKKLDKLKAFIDNITNVQVTLKVEKQSHFVESVLHIRGSTIFASAEHENMYAAVDALVDKLDRQLLKHKEKHMGRNGA